jgi:hypothetical protein
MIVVARPEPQVAKKSSAGAHAAAAAGVAVCATRFYTLPKPDELSWREKLQHAKDVKAQEALRRSSDAKRRQNEAVAGVGKAQAPRDVTQKAMKRGRPVGSRNKQPSKPRKKYRSRAASCTFSCPDPACGCKGKFTEEGAQRHLAHRQKHPRKNGPEQYRFLQRCLGE